MAGFLALLDPLLRRRARALATRDPAERCPALCLPSAIIGQFTRRSRTRTAREPVAQRPRRSTGKRLQRSSVHARNPGLVGRSAPVVHNAGYRARPSVGVTRIHWE